MHQKLKTPLLLLAALIVTCFLTNCLRRGDKSLILKRSDFSSVTVIDTLEAYPEKGLYILDLEHGGFLGHFSWNLGIVKCDTNTPGNSARYESVIMNQRFTVSKDYIAYNKTDSSSYGWFFMENGKLLPKLPSIDKIERDLNPDSAKDLVFSEFNGDIRLLRKGELIKRYNYGNIILKNNTQNFDSLDLGLYKAINDDVILISHKPDDLFTQREGLYFVPKPGHHLLVKYSKKEVLKAVEAAFISNPNPKRIMIKEVQ
ncbi:MAG: hypothetical protein V4722_05080 [Bacteroidota bacterium]